MSGLQSKNATGKALSMKPEEELHLLIIIVLIFLLTVVAYIVEVVLGYELTEQDIKDERTVQTCMEFRINSTECFMLYGGSVVEYGDTVK